MTTKENVICAICNSDKVLSLAWINKNKSFVRWAKGNKTHYCQECNKIVEVSTAKYIAPSIIAWRIL